MELLGNSKMRKISEFEPCYEALFRQIKQAISQSQQRAALAVNLEITKLYWQIGSQIVEIQHQQGWGTGVVAQLAEDLKNAFPDLKGFSRSNLMSMRTFALEWPDFAENLTLQKLIGAIPWGHNVALLNKLSTKTERLFYAQKMLDNGWSRSVLIHQIENKLIERQGNATTNFAITLPSAISELAQQSLKDPYIFDFLNLGEKAKERDLEKALTEKISQFLLELGAGFAFVGKQVHLDVGGDDFYIDLLFYHLKMHCYVVIELKTTEFKPEHIGQLNFYLAAVDSQIKTESDKPTIGLLLCKTKNRLVAEYALRHNTQPIGVAEYQFGQTLPKELQDQLPSIEALEKKLNASGLI